MADLKSLKLRITGVKKTEKITKAMKMVAASKLRRARIAAEDCREGYNQVLESYNRHIKIFSAEKDDLLNLPFVVGEKTNSHLLVVLTTDRGLCGGLNSHITKFTLKRIEELEAKNIDVSLVIYGKKSYEQIKAKSNVKILLNRLNDLSDSFSSRDAGKAYDEIFKIITERNIDNASLVFPKFHSAISQDVIEEQLMTELPVDNDLGETIPQIEYEPTLLEFATKFLALKINFQIFHAMKETYACEQGARMTAMDNAVNNCRDLVKKLNLVYNRTRQAKITTELIEIISASESI
jgi:F-type H+-transporting ATPase subunit gamma